MKATTTKNEPTIAQSLVLCHYSVTAPALHTLNRAASARVTAQAHAANRAARVYNTILQAKGTSIGRAVSLLQMTGVKLRRLGLPCPAGGIYLRIRDIQQAQNIFDDAMLELDKIRMDILTEYPEMEAKVRADLSDFANEVNIPSATEVASRFTMRLTIINRPVAVDNAVLKGLSTEVANRVRAESEMQINEMLKAAHAGPLEDLRKQLAEFIDKMRNAERLHLTQFDKLRAETDRVRNLNVLDLPEINDVLIAISDICVAPLGVPEQNERNDYAKRAETVAAKADATLAALGL